MDKTFVRKRGQQILALMLILVMCLSVITPVQGAEIATAETLRTVQQEILNWRTGGDKEYFLSEEFLTGAGDSGCDWYALNLARMQPDGVYAEYLSALESVVSEKYQNLEETKNSSLPTDWYRLILTIGACGGDPQNFGTDKEGNPIDLVNDGIWNCIFEDPGMQGINGYIWALIAVDSGNYQERSDAKWTREDLLAALLSSQQEDGGYGISENSGSDSDITAMALTALAPYRDVSAEYVFADAANKSVTITAADSGGKAFGLLSELQADDGSMTAASSSAESTSWAIMALTAWGKDVQEEEAFIKNGNSLIDGLLSFQSEKGGILHTLDPNSTETDGNGMASYQALYAIEAYCRLLEGKTAVFDYSDLSESEETEAAEEAAPLEDEAEENAPDLLTIVGISAIAVVAVTILLAIVLNREKKPGQTDPSHNSDIDP